MFVPLPGPDSATAKGIAARHAGALTGLGDAAPVEADLDSDPRA